MVSGTAPNNGLPGVVLACVGFMILAALASGQSTASDAVSDQAVEKTRAEKIVGPVDTQNNCASCHTLEAEAWQHTRHYGGFSDRHRSKRAKEVLRNMSQRSMKRGTSTNNCRQCHYTSTLKRDRAMPTWGVSCESCHGPAADWIDIHDKVGGDPTNQALDWGEGRSETKPQRRARLDAARVKGMIHSEMIYEIAAVCLSCHAVPNETLVNEGDHKAGSDFELVTWLGGEIRHNFASSPGAPDTPTNRSVTPEQRRVAYVVGATVDLEHSLRNLASVTHPGGKFHKAMTARVERIRKKILAILAVVDIPGFAAVMGQLPEGIDDPTSVSADVLKKLSEASKQFVEAYDGSELEAIDSQILTDLKGKVYKK